MRTPNAALFSFRELFNTARGPETTFRIPDYQRAYSWDKPQRSDLLSDIEKLRSQRSHWSGDSAAICPSHFCGTVICTPAEAHTHYIVDGEQRLTSLVILHRCLSNALGDNSPHPLRCQLFPQAIDKNLFIDLLAYTKHTEPVTEGQKRYVNARDEFDGWVAELNDPEVEKTLSAIEDGLTFILFTLENDHEVSKVFESVNNRGKPLTQMDLVKNHLLFLEGYFECEPRVNETWKKILGEVANTDFRGGEDPDTVLRAVVSAMFHPGRRQAGETDFKIVAKKIDDDNGLLLFIQFLEFSFGVFRELRALSPSRSARSGAPMSRHLRRSNARNAGRKSAHVPAAETTGRASISAIPSHGRTM